MKKFYLKERHNPQFDKPYYVVMGKMFKKDSQKHEKPIYGSCNMMAYDTEEDYCNAIKKLKADGFTIQ